MAVSKIRKISNLTLLVLLAASLVVLGFFYLGGIVPGTENMEEPVPMHLGTLLYWMYGVLGLALVVTVLSALVQLIMLFRDNLKSAIESLAIIILFFGLFVVGYLLGDGTPLNIQGYDGTENTSFWNSVTDMWIYTTYIFLALISCVLIWGVVKKAIGK